jgi:hypothetical protein
MPRRLLSSAVRAALLALALLASCSSDDTSRGFGRPDDDDDATTNDPAATADSGAADGGSTTDHDGDGPALPSDVPKTGTIDVTLTADKAAANDAVVSLGVPFPQGVFSDEKLLTLKNGATPVPITATFWSVTS